MGRNIYVGSLGKEIEVLKHRLKGDPRRPPFWRESSFLQVVALFHLTLRLLAPLLGFRLAAFCRRTVLYFFRDPRRLSLKLRVSGRLNFGKWRRLVYSVFTS